MPDGSEHFPPGRNEREVGYWIGLPMWNKGLTTEALKIFAEFCKTALNLDSLLITTDANNIASQRIAEKCGFSFISDYSFEGNACKAYRLILNF